MTMNNKPLYNSRIIKNYVEYVRKYLPDLDIDLLLRKAQITPHQIEDGGHWFSQNDVERFHAVLSQETGDTSIPRKAGRFAPLSKAAGAVSQYMIGFIDPSSVYNVIDKIAFHVDRGHTWKVKKLAHNKFEIEATPNPEVYEKPFQCENRHGMLEGISALFTGIYAHVDHPSCVHRGEQSCVYLVTLDTPAYHAWKRIRNGATVLGAAISIALSFRLPVENWVLYTLFIAVVLLSLSLYASYREKEYLSDSIRNQSDSASALLDQINKMYRNATLIHEVGKATSTSLDIKTILSQVVEAMEKRLEFDRGMIMLANPEKTRLIYAAGYGYDPEHTDYLSGIEFHLDNPFSRGPLNEAFHKQIPVTIEDVGKIENHLSKRSQEFARRMGAESFVCVPIVYENESLGVVLVDNIRSKKIFTQSELHILQGLATQIAISIKNALAYKTIQESEARFRSLSENAPDIIYNLDTHGAFTYINPAWEKILGHKREEIIGRYFIDFVKKEDIPTYKSLFKKIRDEKLTITDYTGVLLHKDGTERTFIMSCAPNVDLEGNVIGAVGVFKDTTESKKLEAQLHQAQKMEAIGTLAGGIAHNFNNLLMGIQGYTSLMLFDINPNHPFYKKLKSIEEIVQSAADLTRQLLGFARGGKYEAKPTNLNELIEKTTRIFEKTKKEIIIHRWYEKNLWSVTADHSQIEQVLMNLYVNAWQAMPSGGEIYIETENVYLGKEAVKAHDLKEGPYVRVSVRDTGVGMDEHTRNRVFEPFFTTKEKGRGTGLGLASVYGIIKNHHGFITVESSVGVGTTFTLYLPATEDTQEGRPEVRVEEPISYGKGTILVVDDEEMVLQVTKSILESLGYRALLASSGEDAITMYSSMKDRINLVILDMIMPRMNGEETFKVLKRISPEVKVLISSGYSMDQMTLKMIDEGCCGWIEKPFTMKKLSQKLKEVLTTTTH